MKGVPKTAAEVRATYRAILAAAKVFPSKNRAGLIDEIRREFRSCKDVTDEAEVVRLRRLALQSLEQLQSFTSNKSSQRDWSCRLSRPMTILMKMALASACSERLMLTMAGLQAHARQQQCIRQWYSASSALLLAKRRGKGGEGGEGGCGRRAHANRSTASAESVRLDGISASARWRARIQEEVARLLKEKACIPGLGVIVVGDRRDSLIYVNRKALNATRVYVSFRALQVSAAREVGMMATDLHLPSHSTTEEIVAAVRWMCDAKHLHGVMVQLPLPDHVDEALVLREIDEGKDVDGLAPANTGAMMTRTSIAATSCSTAARDGHHDTSDGVDMRGFRQCTPVGCAELLRQHDVHVKGKRVVVLGTTNTAGTPLGMQMRDLGALSVTLCSVPKSLGNDDDDTLERVKAISRDADILAVMIGHAELVTDEWVKPGAAVLDVGINTLDVPDPTTGRPFTVVGDVDFHSVSRVASFVSPVPGGAGPMTVSALLSNVLRATQRHCAASSTSPPLSSSSLPQQSSSPS